MPRPISWTQALRDLKASHAAATPVREQRLRSTAGLRGTPALALSAWRGRSGRRYVVSVNDACGLDPETVAVVIAVARDPAGLAAILAVGIAPGFAAPIGTTELHVHRLAETDDDRAAIVADLAPLDVIDGALALLARPEAWCQGAAARDAAGAAVSPLDARAVAWDIGGAVERAAGLDADAADAADARLHDLCHGVAPSAVNDDASTTHADVVSLLRRAQAPSLAA